jgi:hypothetical protein
MMREQNLWGETVDQCAQRFLRDARTADVEPSEHRAYARERAESCIRIFRHSEHDGLSDFYLRVSAFLSEG